MLNFRTMTSRNAYLCLVGVWLLVCHRVTFVGLDGGDGHDHLGNFHCLISSKEPWSDWSVACDFISCSDSVSGHLFVHRIPFIFSHSHLLIGSWWRCIHSDSGSGSMASGISMHVSRLFRRQIIILQLSSPSQTRLLDPWLRSKR